MATDLYEVNRKVRLEQQGLRAEGYTGKNRFYVTMGTRGVMVASGDPAGAIWTAARHWGMDPTKAEVHQNIRVVRG